VKLAIRPILSSLRHHQLTAGLLALQVALTCAIVANATFMIANRVERVRTPTGLPEDEISMISVDGVLANTNVTAQQQTDLAALRAIPGVTAAVATGWTLPLSAGANDRGGCASQAALDRAMATRSLEHMPGCIESTYYNGSPGFVQALGARVVSGRDFHPDEYGTDGARPVIISRSLAHQLWPGENAVGKTLYGWDSKVPVVGVIDDILRPLLRSDALDRLVVLSPQVPDDDSVRYLLRSAPQDRQRVLATAADALAKAGPVRLIPEDGKRTFAQMRQKYFQRDFTMIGLLLAAMLGLLFVTALGIGGLANFWVQQRTHQIGIRRAIGATRGDILRHFLLENFLIVTAGVVLGMLLAYALNQWLMSRYELSRLPLHYLPIGAVMLWLLGQIAVYWPARRAAAIPPAMATRSA
jgi:putative ABC transport system permease protein